MLMQKAIKGRAIQRSLSVIVQMQHSNTRGEHDTYTRFSTPHIQESSQSQQLRSIQSTTNGNCLSALTFFPLVRCQRTQVPENDSRTMTNLCLRSCSADDPCHDLGLQHIPRLHSAKSLLMRQCSDSGVHTLASLKVSAREFDACQRRHYSISF